MNILIIEDEPLAARGAFSINSEERPGARDAAGDRLFQKEEIIFLHTTTGDRYISEHQALDKIENLLAPKYFFRMNRQYIVHSQSVARIKTTRKGLTVQLKPLSQAEIDVSREKAAAFKSWIDH